MIGRKGKILFLCFTILALVLVVAVFLQLSAGSFAADPAVAFSASLYIGMALLFGVLIYKYRVPLWLMTVVMVPIVIYACWYGNYSPWVAGMFKLPMETWRWILVVYIFLARSFPCGFFSSPATTLPPISCTRGHHRRYRHDHGQRREASRSFFPPSRAS